MIKRSFRLELREKAKGLIGYAFKFSETADYFGLAERFDPALELELNPTGCFLFRDHNPERVLARAGQNLEFETDKTGLLFRAGYLDTGLWKETRELVAKGVLTGVSVGFQSLTERKQDDVLVYQKIRLFEVSIVNWPAYKSSEVQARENKTLKHKDLPPELFF